MNRDRVLIFGATSAVAAQVAMRYARRGAQLHLVGRNPDKLAQAAKRCISVAATAKGEPREPRVSTQVADFDDLGANGAVVATAITALGGVDAVLIAHGYLGDQLDTEREFEAASKTFCTNLLSVVSLLVPLANHLESARAGRLGVITSVAGDRGRPRNYTYGAAKGALNIYLQGLRTRLYPARVTVTTLKLGPVDTPMTRDHAKHVLFGRPERVAVAIVRAIEAGMTEAYVPSFWGAIMPVVKNMPERVIQRLSFLSGR